ncbi:hypothetical protein AVEN_35242-1 [Araneus ventricosus]|uniref:Uncharacterized protein n=1 Tax=Araneus ventricosus TaxID=182803 RepID=A0A4Y2UYB1_ARAVE|nr:hypothetical protein AVEN_35242-1 [Araneus ventricosus]
MEVSEVRRVFLEPLGSNSRRVGPLRGSPSVGEYGCPNPEVPRDLYSLPVYPPLSLQLIPSIPRRQARELSMRSCCHSVCFLLLMDS